MDINGDERFDDMDEDNNQFEEKRRRYYMKNGYNGDMDDDNDEGRDMKTMKAMNDFVHYRKWCKGNEKIINEEYIGSKRYIDRLEDTCGPCARQ